MKKFTLTLVVAMLATMFLLPAFAMIEAEPVDLPQIAKSRNDAVELDLGV